MSAFLEETVLSVHHWTDRLFSFKTTRDETLRFSNGHFTMIGLRLEGGKPLLRAYSIVSANYEDHLEFLSIKVQDGPLTSRLQHIQVGDKIVVGKKPTGTLLIDYLLPGKNLYLFGTGTGVAPFLSIVRDPETYERFEKVILVHGVREVAELGVGDFILSSNQNLCIARVTATAKKKIDAILERHGVSTNASSGLRRNSMACVSLPTCGLALAESERFLPTLITDLESILDKTGLRDDDIVIRMTGCPNGCARPYLAEIGLVGRGPGLYNLYLGAAFDGSRLSKLAAGDVDHAGILRHLEPLLFAYAQQRQAGERFGNFLVRTGHVKATTAGNNFHA
jgi:ferredoxin-NADP reductase